MITEEPDASKYDKIDTQIGHWRQGDFILEKIGFIKKYDPNMPLIDIETSEEMHSDIYEDDVAGVVIVSQTCDIIRSSKERPYILLCPLVFIDNKDYYQQIKKAMIPRYAYISGSEDKRLVADLDRVMTIEKAMILKWKKHCGCLSDEQQRLFANTLSRKFARYAFPDDFVDLLQPITNRIKKKHNKDSDEGKFLQAVREIRVKANPEWNADKIELLFLFILDDNISERNKLDKHCDELMERLSKKGKYISLDYELLTMDELSMREYIESDRIDLDYLSISNE